MSVFYLPELVERSEIIGEEVEAGVLIEIKLHLARRPIGDVTLPFDDRVSERSESDRSTVVVACVAEGDKEDDN